MLKARDYCGTKPKKYTVFSIELYLMEVIIYIIMSEFDRYKK